MKYTYFLRSESGDDYLVTSDTDYTNAIDFMKNECQAEYEAWKVEGYEDEDIPYADFYKVGDDEE